MQKPARHDRNRPPLKASTEPPAADAPAPVKKPRVRPASARGDFNAELRALADKHRKKSAKLRASVAKLEGKLEGLRAQLDKADEPLRKIERVLADHPELPGLDVAAPEAEAAPPPAPAPVELAGEVVP